MHLNLTADMMPGLFLLFAGAAAALFSERLCRKKANVPALRLLGTGLAFIGAILVFLT